MPSSPDSQSKKSLPQKRTEGEGPRAFADDTPLNVDTAHEEISLPPAPLELKANSPRTPLPQRTQDKAHAPIFTPAHYQAEQVKGAKDAPLAKLPPKRSIQQSVTPKNQDSTALFPLPRKIQKKEEHEIDPPELPNYQKSRKTREIAESWKEALSTNVRLGAEEKAPFREYQKANYDPEDTGTWGSNGDTNEGGRSFGKKLILFILLLAIPLFGFVIWQNASRKPHLPVAPATIPTSAKRILPADQVRQATELARQFLAATTIEERAQFVRHPHTTIDRMKAWHTPANPITAEQILRFDERSTERTIDDRIFIALNMEMEDYSIKSIALEKIDDSFKVDWESYVAWAPMPWDAYLNQRPKEPMDFRVFIEPETYYNFSYSDESKYICFKLSDPTNTAHSWGYCLLDSPAGLELNRLLRQARQNGNNFAKAILQLRFSQEDSLNQVDIDAVVQEGWIKVNP